ncbi:MAG: phosphate ABC transporter permease PstA [Acidimicrobiales bacterium]
MTLLDVDQPRSVRNLGRTDLFEMAVAFASGVSLAIVLSVVMDWTNPLTLAVWGCVGFSVAQWLLVRDRAGSVVATDRLVTSLVWSSGLFAMSILGWMILYVAAKGIPGLSVGFFTDDMGDVGPLNPGGGAFHAVVGTLQQTGLATAVSVPVGILTAIYLNEMRGRLASVVRFVVDAMSGIPSVVAGLLVYTVWVSPDLPIIGKQGFSGVAASMALTVVMLPFVTRSAEEMLRIVPGSLREASLALGAPEWRTILKVVLPTARSGLVTAAILGVARVVGETAPVLLTAFGSASTNYSPFHAPQSDLPLFVWSLLKQPNAVQIQRAWTGALVLVALVLVLFTIARAISNRGARLTRGSR